LAYTILPPEYGTQWIRHIFVNVYIQPTVYFNEKKFPIALNP